MFVASKRVTAPRLALCDTAGMRIESTRSTTYLLLLLALPAGTLGCGAPSTASASAPFVASHGCSETEYRRLDFWLGEWEVTTPDGKVDGTNRITKVAGRCALEEDWRDHDGSRGRSVFFFDRGEKAWKQIWVTSDGAWKEKREVSGAPPGGLRFEGRVPLPGGGAALDRTTLTPLPDGRVRQVIAQSTDDGATWRTWEGLYSRPKARPSCEAKEHRQFDFWIGTWDLVVRARKSPGSEAWDEAKATNDIRATHGGCVIEESFHADGPGNPWAGHSVSTFTKGKWRQTWVDDQASYLPFVGEWKDGAMTLTGEPQSANGKPFQMRMVFSEITKNAIHWTWERTTDEGATWTPSMTIDYHRRP